MFKKLNSYIFLLFFCLLINASNDEKNSLIEIYDNPNDTNLINIVVKDNIDIGGKVTSAGSLALKDNIAANDAFIIDKLKRANYHIFGKANLSEWANFRSDDSVSGWSSLGGQTKHFIDDAYNPCGSSSGSAVAVSMGIVDIAIGTETNGSISCQQFHLQMIGMKLIRLFQYQLQYLQSPLKQQQQIRNLTHKDYKHHL
jgi:amidase